MGNEKEKQLLDLLENMPNIVDDIEKDRLYNQISLRLSEEKTPKRKRKKQFIIPLLATAVVLLFLVSLPILFNSGLNQTTSFNESSEDRAYIQMDKESSSTVFDSEESANESEVVTEAEDDQNLFRESRVVNAVDSESQIMNLAIYDDQLQQVIPISLILPEDKILEGYYNNLVNILDSENILPDNYLLEGLKFQLDFKNNEVLLKTPKDFTLEVGTGRAVIFQQLLEEMFGPYGIERIVFTSNEGAESAALMEISIPEKRYASYMIYDEKYLVPISQELTNSINVAIEALKTEIPESNLTSTIPENISFQIDDSQSDLILTYTGVGNIDDSHITTTTIESILLTAKSYGYERVLFKNMPVNSAGSYHFSESIDVPIGINPIDHTN